MADSYNKKERSKKKAKKKLEKQARKEARKEEDKDTSLENMMVYVNEFGQLVETPPTEKKEVDINEISINGVGEVVEEDSTLRGKILFFNEDKGYGFVKDSKTEDSHFFHINDTQFDDVSINKKVTFELAKGKKGLVAVNVSLDE